MTIHVRDDIEELREELAELRAEIKRATKLVRARSARDHAPAGSLRHGIARNAARLATNVMSESLSSRAEMLREPIERAITRHPLGTAALGVAATILLQRYIGLARVARAAALAAGWRLG